jgi:L-fuculose-phosphate aldolase
VSLDEPAARRALVAAARRLDAAGLNVNASGNLSVRVGNGMLVTPSGIAPDELEPADCVVLVGTDGFSFEQGARTPSSEWRLHAEVYAQRAGIDAIVHTHSPEATAAATLGVAIPAVHYVVARFGGADLACAPYATYGTPDLANAVATTLGTSRSACLMANHGAICVAADLDRAVALALDVEWFCGVYRRAITLGAPQVLDADEISRVAGKLATYGQPSGHQR